jgi:hypothetical protein
MPTKILRTTSSTRPISPAVGEMYFETDTNNFIIYDGTNWRGYAANDVVYQTFSNNSYSGYFDGSGDYVTIPTISELNAPSAVSTSMWFRPQLLSGNRALFSAGSSSSNRFFIQLVGATTIRYGIAGSTTDASVSLSTNTWYNLITVQNGTALEIFLDGSSVKTATISAPGSGAGTSFKIGTYAVSMSPTSFFQGNIDEFAIYDTALSSTEVSSIYNDNLLADRVALWRFENDFTDNEGSYDGANNGVTFAAKADDSTNTPY